MKKINVYKILLNKFFFYKIFFVKYKLISSHLRMKSYIRHMGTTNLTTGVYTFSAYIKFCEFVLNFLLQFYSRYIFIHPNSDVTPKEKSLVALGHMTWETSFSHRPAGKCGLEICLAYLKLYHIGTQFFKLVKKLIISILICKKSIISNRVFVISRHLNIHVL